MKKLRRKARVWSFMIVFSVLLQLCSCAGSYQLKVPDEYTAFSGDVSFQYTTPNDVTSTDAYIRLLRITESLPEEIRTFTMNPRYKSMTFKIQCGEIQLAGTYEFQMYMYYKGPIVSRSKMIVRWPAITLKLPDVPHNTRSTSGRLLINSNSSCNPESNRYNFSIDLSYAKDAAVMAIPGKDEIIYSRPFETFTASNLIFEFPCSLFDIPGLYRATLKSCISAISIVARSNAMVTVLNPNYDINVMSATIFPCFRAIDLYYIQPECPGSKEQNLIRIYMLRRMSAGSLALPLFRTYVEERFADPGGSRMHVNCSVFQTTAAGYCFQYVTVTRDGGVLNQTQTCVSAHRDSVFPIDGGWGDWTSWGDCSARCGPGKQTRYRMCDSPTPNYGGAFCEGDSIQRKSCNPFCIDTIPHTPLHSPVIEKRCRCGCNVHKNNGEIIASGRCDQRISTWLISVETNHKILLKFKYINLYLNKQWVRVRNGASPRSDLIAYIDNNDDVSHVTSTANQILLEFYSDSGNGTNLNENKEANDTYPVEPTKPIHVFGFIASFTSNESLGSPYPIIAQPIRSSVKPSIWESTVAIVGIALCSVVIVTAVAFVIYHRACHKRHHKYSMATHEESPKRVCKSTSMPSSPSHESHHGIEIEHDMEIPLTGLPSNGEKKRAKTPGSTKSRTSMASACSNNLKKLRTKVEIEHNVATRASPSTPGRDYHQIPQHSSPRKHSRTHEDSENMSLFRTSPLLSAKVPRSPKVHPSPKVMQVQTSRTPNSGDGRFDTKHDMLASRFDGGYRGQRRVVMGSDCTPTGSTKSPLSDSVKLDCETPTNINHSLRYDKRNNNTERIGTVTSANNGSDAGRNNPNEIKLEDVNKANADIERNPASGTSDESTSAEKDTSPLMTTSFIETPSKPRRPTSLTESYSKMSLASSLGKLSDGSKHSADCSKDKTSLTSSDDRQNALPKPDGQSPKSPRIEVPPDKQMSKNGSPAKMSKNSTPRSVRSLRSEHGDSASNGSKTKSPARSINTPSDVVELEYDDFIDMDDTYSYFDPLETEKLTWHGVERVVPAKTPKAEENGC